MAPSTSAETSNENNTTATLKEAVKCFNGTIDFDKLAIKLGVANAEAMRKRFKRLFDKDEEPLQMKGSSLGTAAPSDIATPTKKAPKTPKVPSTPKSSSPGDDEAEAGPSTPKTPRAAGRKRRSDAKEQSAKKQKTTAVKSEEVIEDTKHENDESTEEDVKRDNENSTE